MKEDIKSALKQAIRSCLPVLNELSPKFQEPYLRWTATPDGTWRGDYVSETCLHRVFTAAEMQLQEATANFSTRFFSEYPEYGPGKLVGAGGLSYEQLAHDPAGILKRAFGHIWDKFGRFECPEDDIDVLVQEFEEFVEGSAISIGFQAQLLNFQMPAEKVVLTPGLTIRKLNDREVSKFHGGPLMRSTSQPFSHRVHEFLIEGTLLGKKVFAGEVANVESVHDAAYRQLNKAVLCLRTFNEGTVGYGWVHFKSVKFCPLVFASYGSFEMLVHPGVYKLSEEQVAALPQHGQLIFGLAESALETACARLADAEARLRPQDQLLDAVIGMEAILLAGLAKEDRKGELKFRFAMNYSSLLASPAERERAYKEAKDLYDHRSAIAHGGDVGSEPLRIGKEKVPIHEAAKRARSALRGLILRFLPHAKEAPYKKPGFWEQAYFRLPESNITSV